MLWDIYETADILTCLVCRLVADVGSDYKASHNGPKRYIFVIPWSD